MFRLPWYHCRFVWYHCRFVYVPAADFFLVLFFPPREEDLRPCWRARVSTVLMFLVYIKSTIKLLPDTVSASPWHTVSLVLSSGSPDYYCCYFCHNSWGRFNAGLLRCSWYHCRISWHSFGMFLALLEFSWHSFEIFLALFWIFFSFTFYFIFLLVSLLIFLHFWYSFELFQS